MKQNLLICALIIIGLFMASLIINPRLGSYTITADVCPAQTPPEVPLHLIQGQTLQHQKKLDKPSKNPSTECRMQVTYVQYLR